MSKDINLDATKALRVILGDEAFIGIGGSAQDYMDFNLGLDEAGIDILNSMICGALVCTQYTFEEIGNAGDQLSLNQLFANILEGN